MIGVAPRHRPAIALGAFTLVTLAATAMTADGGLPVGVLALGGISATAVSLHAAGLVLVHRATRVINFAQVQMSVLGGLLFASLVQRRLPLVALHEVCRPCLDVPDTVGDLTGRGERARDVLEALGLFGAAPGTPLDEAAAGLGSAPDPSMLAASVAPGWLVHTSYWLSLIVAVGLVVGLVWAVHALFVKRFSDAPRLLLTVATLGAGEFALTSGRRLLRPLLEPGLGEPPVAGPVPPPFDLHIDLAPTVIGAGDLLAIAATVVLLGALTWLLARTGLGAVLRGTAENPVRARTLGVNVHGVTSRAWMLAGLLGGTAAVITTARVGAGAVEGFGTLTAALVAAVAGGLTALPLAVAGALCLSVVNQALLWATERPGYVDVAVLVLVAVLLAARRTRTVRAERESSATWQASTEIRPIPAELRGRTTVRRGVVTVTAGTALVVAGYPWFMSPAQISLGQTTMITAIVGLSLLVLTGWAGQISLGQVGFAAVGAFVAAATGLPFVAALPLGAVCGAVVAAGVGVPALRLRGLYLAIASVAFGAAASSVLLDGNLLGRHLEGVRRPILLGIDLNDDRSFYYLVLGFLVATIVAIAGLRRSRTGRALIATRDNELAAEAYGISLLRARLTAFAISGGIAASAGVLLAYAQGGAEAQSFTPTASVTVFLTTIVGGVGAISGPVLGAAFFGVLQLLGTTPVAFAVDLLESGGLLVVVVLLFLPGGLAGAVFGARDSWLRRIAARERLVVPSLVADAGRLSRSTLPIAANQRPGGGTAFVPRRYRLRRQWALPAPAPAAVDRSRPEAARHG